MSKLHFSADHWYEQYTKLYGDYLKLLDKLDFVYNYLDEKDLFDDYLQKLNNWENMGI